MLTELSGGRPASTVPIAVPFFSIHASPSAISL
jgi:hypothetical protein